MFAVVRQGWDGRVMPRRGAGDAVLAVVAERARAEAGGVVGPGVLAGFLPALVGVAGSDRRLGEAELAWCREVGAQAAVDGVALPVLVDVYLSAARLVWARLGELLPRVGGRRPSDRALLAAGQTVLRAADDALAAVATGFMAARRAAVRAEEASRREFVDDVLAGPGNVEDLVARAERFGIGLTAPHVVVVAAAERPFADAGVAVAGVEDQLRARARGREVLVATKEGRLVCVLSAGTGGGQDADQRLFGDIAAEVGWRVVIGRAHPGPGGIAASYREAREGLTWAARLDWPEPVVQAQRLAVYRVLMRDRDAITELLTAVLGPLTAARGGAGPLLDTLAAFLACGGVATKTARRLHLSVRAVTYRLDRVRQLTGYDPTDPADWLTLQVAVTGARLLDWPPS